MSLITQRDVRVYYSFKNDQQNNLEIKSEITEIKTV